MMVNRLRHLVQQRIRTVNNCSTGLNTRLLAFQSKGEFLCVQASVVSTEFRDILISYKIQYKCYSTGGTPKSTIHPHGKCIKLWWWNIRIIQHFAILMLMHNSLQTNTIINLDTVNCLKFLQTERFWNWIYFHHQALREETFKHSWACQDDQQLKLPVPTG